MGKARLYINGQEVDYGQGEHLLLFTYGAGDLDAPAVVQNAYSKELVLPPTARNAKVLGALWRADKVGGADDTFNTLARTPFEIRDTAGSLLERGYCKVQGVCAREGYSVTLFGELGSFLYGLMYNEDGTKKTLADLRWSEPIEQGLNFTINASAVALAWGRLYSAPAGEVLTAWDVVNFAPMHNGRPTDFDCRKGLVPVGPAHGCPVQTGKGGVNIGGTDYALVDFGAEFGEWDVRDLRSYLQRPVFRMRALLEALKDGGNNGGYTFDCSAVEDLDDMACWMTLPMLNTQDAVQEQQTLTMEWDTYRIEDWDGGTRLLVEFNEAIDEGKKVDVSLSFRLRLSYTAPAGVTPTDVSIPGDYLFLRAIGCDEDDNPVVFGKVRCVVGKRTQTEAYLPLGTPFAAAKKLTGSVPSEAGRWNNPVLGAFDEDSFEQQMQGTMTAEAGGWATTDALTLEVSGYGVHHVRVAAIGLGYFRGVGRSGVSVTLDGDAVAAVDLGAVNSPTCTATQEAVTHIRSGAYITKRDLLGGTASPAELLLGLVKAFGYVLTMDAQERVVRVVQRSDFYTGTCVDITPRIDRTQRIDITPNGITEKWLRFAFGNPTGGFAERYESKYRRPYGDKRVNTGSPFNADTLEVLDGTPFVGAVTGIAFGRYYWLAEDSNVATGVLPAPFLDNASKYTLWDISGNPTEYPVPALTAGLVLQTINRSDYPTPEGYDATFRLQLAAADGAGAQGGAGVLVWLDAWGLEYAHVTDDSAQMLNVNNGAPCWIPCVDSSPALRVPAFITLRLRSNAGGVVSSLDMGTPLELCGWDYGYPEGRCVYDRRWRAYIADRYSADAHRCTCYVDWRGVPVGQSLFAPFYWFDGCCWVLDKVEDWCWDNPQPVKCTFVRVLDRDAYTGGQE